MKSIRVRCSAIRPLPSIAGLDLQAVDEVDHVCRSGRGRQIGCSFLAIAMAICVFAGAGTADQDGVTLLGDEAAAGEIIDQRLVDGCAFELESPQDPLASGSLAMVSWYLIERACFSLISALSRSPTMR